MIGYLGAQIGHHQVAYKAVASRLQVQARIDVATHIKVANDRLPGRSNRPSSGRLQGCSIAAT
eukprot:scaffold14371_cov74-Skeletonema_menzelii.AAC.1